MVLSGLLGGQFVPSGLLGLKEHVKLGNVGVKAMAETVKKD